MPWLTIIMFLLSYFAQRAEGASAGKALLTAGLVGAGTYYVTHETEWGQANLGDLDGVSGTVGEPVLDANGNTIPDGNGGVLRQVIGGTTDVLKSWGATGTAGVIATTSAASGGLFSGDNMKYLLLAAAAFFLLTK